MEPVGNAVYYILANDATVSGMVGTDIYQNLVPQTLVSNLYIRHLVTDVLPYDTKSGPSTLDEMFVTIDIIGKKDQDCLLLAGAVRDALDRVTPGTYASVVVQGVRFEAATMLPEMADSVDMYTYTMRFKFRVGR